MQKTQKKLNIQSLTLLALLTTLVAVLSYMGSFIKLGGLATISLTLIPVVLGAALFGKGAGAFLGGVSGVVFLITPGAAFWYGISIPGTIITVMIKGVLCGFCAGLVYKLLEKINKYLAVIAAAIICPVVNTGIFLLGCVLFFFDEVTEKATVAGISTFVYMIVFFVGWNFVFELLSNILFSPSILRLLNIRKKTQTNKM